MVSSIYFDANSTTPLLPEVVEAMRPFWLESFGNASSIHRHGQKAHAAVERARQAVAQLIGAEPAEIVFTSGGTESDNHAIAGVLLPCLTLATPGSAPPHLITSAIEHHAVLHAAEALRDLGAAVTILPCTPGGLVDPVALAAALTPQTRLVSIMLANNETGVVQPVAELAAIAHRAGALFHTDAVQFVGKLSLDVRELGVDLLTLSAHKMHGPKGVGALFIRRGVSLRPLHFGGPHEGQRRAGTENVSGVVGMGRAADLALAWLADTACGSTTLAALRDLLETKLLSTIPGSGINGAHEVRLPNTLNLYVDGIDAEALLIALDLQGVSISAGSACQSGATEPSHVLRAMGLDDARARASVRLSLSRLNTPAEIDVVVGAVRDVVSRLRGLRSPSARRREPMLSAVR